MARHLLDSDVLISALRGTQNIVNYIRDIAQREVPAISACSFYEIWAGVRPGEQEIVSQFLEALDVLAVDESVALQGAEYWRQFRNKGKTLGAIDTMIAATARLHGLILVTSNLRDFPMSDIEKVEPGKSL